MAMAVEAAGCAVAFVAAVYYFSKRLQVLGAFCAVLSHALAHLPFVCMCVA